MRLTTKFSAFVTLLTGLTIFVTLIGCSLSFYNAIENKFTSRIQAVATAIDTHLVSSDFVTLTPQINELMVSVDIVRVDLLQDGRQVYSHSRNSSYRPAGSNNLYRELTIPLVKHPGTSLHVVFQDPMGNYFHSLVTTAPLTLAIGFIVLILFLSVRWLQRQLSGQELLEDQEKVGSHGVVMMIRLPDFNLLHDSWGRDLAEEQLFALINLLSTFIMRYPGSLLVRYHRSDFAVLLPHRTLKEAESIAGQLLKAVDALPVNKKLDRDDMVHIGICAWRSGQSTEQVMEHAEAATRNAVLQGGNSWAVYDDSLPEKGRGNVRWRTLIEQMLSRGGPRIYQKPAVMREGRVHHRELMCRIFDGAEEVISAEYMPMVLQFGLSEEYDRLQISRLIPLLKYWPEENLAMQVTVESLIRPRFQRWLRDTLMQCEKSQRKRIIFELAEADVCQHISRLQPVIRLMNALGVRIAVTQAGLTLVSTSWIKELNVGLLKLHPSLVRNIEKRTENQLLVQSLVEACTGTHTQVYATGVRSRSEWHTLTGRGVAGGQGDFFASSQPLDTNVKKYSQRYSV